MIKVLAIMGIFAGTCTADLDLSDFPKKEVLAIEAAIQRNGINHPDLEVVVYAIRKAENGGSGREFGILHPKAKTFDDQAGWCVATVNKNYERWTKGPDKTEPFIVFLGKRYAPVGAENDPNSLNFNWVGNVTKWVLKITGKK